MKLYPIWLISLAWLLVVGCRQIYEAPVPYTGPDIPGAGKFTTSIRQSMEGVYSVTDGSDRFGDQMVVKWTYLREGNDTTYYLSMFAGTDATYFSLAGQPQVDSLALAGYWRKLSNTETGLAEFAVQMKHNGQLQNYAGRLATGDTLVISGLYNDDKAKPTRRLTLTYNRPLNPEPFAILAHRSGGRTSDLLPSSENSVEIIKLASRLGATGIEIDVRYTKDGVPILYHDNNLNLRLIQKNGLNGPIEDYTYKQLTNLVRLINGEKIPTLEEALEAVVVNTPLSFVWLDTKYIGPMAPIQAIQRKYRERAAQLGRNVQIVIGIPSTEALASYEALADKTNTPILSELDTAITRTTLNSPIWAPRWTLGPQIDEVRAMQKEGRTVFVWTLDEPQFIREFINESRFDGILSNYSTLVAYHHYTKQ
ncbi:glycerophosphodiester phosphodiesterase [Spirosoma sp. BT702]|uniref:Glycerophosphodiester phosphodiesterase n=1 Tax=Spirosoma profusum TaxID=2771354 RepID=A0A926XTU7_9BACT|nr:glycerophosphodiester phosphodiesterase family protein [Spirosoma profusum]MBD2699774.1 glycerophosphodiester phosphodiesterase [Spirosoma profusum]